MIVLTGVFLVVAGLLRLGFITQFLSRPVMAGFVFGLAIFVTVSQLPKLLGLEKGDGDTIRQLGHVIRNLGDASLTTVAVGIAALAVLFGIERFAPRVPGGLVVLVARHRPQRACSTSSSHGVAIIGDIPTGLPSVDVPDLRLRRSLGADPVRARHDARDLQRGARCGDRRSPISTATGSTRTRR